MLDQDERVIHHLVIKRDKAIRENCPPPPEFHTLRADMVDEFEVDDDDDEDDNDEEWYDDKEGDVEDDDENDNDEWYDDKEEDVEDDDDDDNIENSSSINVVQETENQKGNSNRKREMVVR